MGIAAIGQINFSPATAGECHFGDSTKQTTIGDIMRSGDVTARIVAAGNHRCVFLHQD